ncbi:MAG TPA: multidrug efflux RND transporter permease subunit [Pirellulaceae bacterium]|nr:multidrug efflux RND transporter permease subunit [Pirellulaceae bacterium]
MFSRFFIDRPIFATVLSVVITLAGGIAVFTLPITQYPEIAPPTVEVSTMYPGANSQVVADTVAAPIEQQVNGVENMMYMSSQCTNDGTYTLTVTFLPGTDLNLAQVLVQNRVALAQPTLPDLVQRRGVTVKKKSPSVLMIVNLFSPDGSRDNLYLSNYATIQMRDELSRVAGVGDITFLGQRDYSMRVWLDPQQMAMRNISTQDVLRAVEQQNTQVAAGQIGQQPAPEGQVFQYTMTTLGRLTDEEQFGNMVLRSDSDGRLIRLRDVARTELGAVAYDQVCTLDDQPSIALSVYQLPGSNALQTAEDVRTKMDDLKARFPEGVDYAIVYDTTPFIKESVSEVFVALRDAVILVAIVVLVFLQGWRPAIIPLVAVPVAIVGTFAFMMAFSFSLNALTLFGLVLAVGIVVDDAIVVVEAVEHHIEHGLAPRDAAIKAMDQVAGPVIAVGLVLTAVFIPCAFISGVVGQFFRQFAVTIAISTIISAFNSLTLSPALAVLLLKPRSHGAVEALPRPGLAIAGAWAGYALIGPWLATWASAIPGLAQIPVWVWPWVAALTMIAVAWTLSRSINVMLSWAFRAFNRGFHWTTEGYVHTVSWMLRGSAVVLLVYVGMIYATYRVFDETPTGFIPAQDKGYLVLNISLADSASLERTQEVMAQAEKIAGQTPGVRHTVAIAGQSLLLNANAPNFGSMYVMLDDFHHRAHDGLTADEIASRLRESLRLELANANVNVLGAPPIEGLGTAGGFKIVIQDRGDNDLATLEAVAQATVRDGNENPQLRDLFTSFRANTTWLQLDIDRDAAKSMGISMADVFNALQVNFGSLYVNDFNRFGRTWQVNVQADSKFRMETKDLQRMYVTSNNSNSVPLAAFMKIKPITGPLMLLRHNLYRATYVNADAAVGASSGQAIDALKAVADQNLAQSMRTEFTELAYLQQMAGNTAMYAFLLAVVLVFLVLAAQYESWSLPLAVILVVPMCLLCSIVGVIMARMDINIFTQIGFVVLVGLACKNAILIVEFARARHDEGVSTFQATLDACRLRLRPIIMTSLAFIFGVVPLVLGQGAGAEMRRTLGTAVFAGMLGVTLFGIFLTPVFFYVIQRFADWRLARLARRAAAEGEIAAKA